MVIGRQPGLQWPGWIGQDILEVGTDSRSNGKAGQQILVGAHATNKCFCCRIGCSFFTSGWMEWSMHCCMSRHPHTSHWLHCLASPFTTILQDWLFISYKRVDGVEYALLLATFGLVLAMGLEAGIAGGILLAALHFAYRCADRRGSKAGYHDRCRCWPSMRCARSEHFLTPAR